MAPLRVDERPVTRSIIRRLQEGFSNFIQRMLQEESLKSKADSVMKTTLLASVEGSGGQANSSMRNARPGVGKSDYSRFARPGKILSDRTPDRAF